MEYSITRDAMDKALGSRESKKGFFEYLYLGVDSMKNPDLWTLQ